MASSDTTRATPPWSRSSKFSALGRLRVPLALRSNRVDRGRRHARVTPIRRELESRKWTLTHVLNTHWHADHTGGNVELKKFPDVHIVGQRKERQLGVEKIPGIDRKVDDGDSVFVGDVELKVMDVPGHTLGHSPYAARQ